VSQPPTNPKLYHIVHVDRLASIVADGKLLCDEEMAKRPGAGTTVGMSKIKQRRLQLPLQTQPDLMVGGCVPFYFCPRSVMLYLLHRGNDPDLSYRGGQDPIVHLELDLHRTVKWARAQGQRWAFTLSNAGAYYFEDRGNLAELDQIDWNAVKATDWRNPDVKHGKQSEFLVENEVPWKLVERIGVRTNAVGQRALAGFGNATHKPTVEITQDWYY
jgi:hypothetical protein